MKKFNKERLIQARIFRDYTQLELANIINITPQAISCLESGKNSEPTYKTLHSIAQALNFHENFFFLQSLDISNTNYAFRSKKTTVSKKKEQVRVIADLLSEIKYNIIDKNVNLPKTNLIDVEHHAASSIENIDYDSIENIVNQIRKHWGVNDAPISNIVRLLECNGIFNFRIVSRDISAKIDALSWFSDVNPLILLTTAKSGVRSRFDASHELGHLLLHRNMIHENITQEQHNVLEKEADYFASAFLFPKNAVFNEAINATSIDCYIGLKRRWKISIAAIAMRLHALNIITDSQKKYLFIQLSKNGFRTKEPLDDEIGHEDTFLLQEVCRELENNNIINLDDHLYANDMRDILGIPKHVVQPVRPKFEIKNVESKYMN